MVYLSGYITILERLLVSDRHLLKVVVFGGLLVGMVLYGVAKVLLAIDTRIMTGSWDYWD